MKRIATGLFTALFVVGALVAPAVKAATTQLTPTGTGAQGDPYVVTLEDYGAYQYQNASSQAHYFSVTFAKEGVYELGTTEYGEGKFYGGTFYVDGNPYSNGSQVAVAANTTIGIKNTSSAVTSIIYSESTKYTKMEDAYDLSSCTTAQAVSIPQGAEKASDTWFKFSITAPSTLEFEPNFDGAFYGFYKADGKTQALSDKNFNATLADNTSSEGLVKFENLDHNVFIPTNTTEASYSNEFKDKYADGKAKVSFYEAGTYYVYVRGGTLAKNYDRGFKSVVLRPYRPITGLTFSKGKQIDGVEMGKASTVTNHIIGLVPEDADGFPKAIDFDKSAFEITSTANEKRAELTFKGSSFGTYTVSVLDERGEKVDSWAIKNNPKPFVDYSGEGTSNSITVGPWSTNSESAADSVRIYLQKGGKYVLSGTFKGKKATIKKLKANTKYSIKLANYDSKSGAESAMSKAFTVGTAPAGKPKIKSVSNIKITKNTGYLIYNSGKINERREKYTYYAASAKISAAKLKGVSYYEYNLLATSSPNTTNKPTAVMRIFKGGKTAASCKKTVKLQCRAAKKYSNTFSAYTAWSKVKKVKIK